MIISRSMQRTHTHTRTTNRYPWSARIPPIRAQNMSSFNLITSFHVRSSHVASLAKPSPSVLDDRFVLVVSIDVRALPSEVGSGKGSESTVASVPFTGPSVSPAVTSLADSGAASVVGVGTEATWGTVVSLATSAPPSPSPPPSPNFVSAATSASLDLGTCASEVGSATATIVDDTTPSFLTSPATLASLGAGGGGGTARLAAARLGTGGAPSPVGGAGDAGLEEANGDDIFPRIFDTEGGCPGAGDVARAIPVGVGDPVRERLTAGLAGRELGGGDAGEERRERGRGTGDVTREIEFGMVGVMGSGTLRGDDGGDWSSIGGALGSAETGCDAVDGSGEGGTAKVISSMGVEGESNALGSVLSGSM